MDKEITIQKSFLEQIYSILNKLDYEEQYDDGDTAELKAQFSLDYFYSVKNELEYILYK